MLLVQDAVATEAGDGAKRRSALDAELLGLLEQPLEKCNVPMRPVLVNVEAQYRALHDVPHA